MNKLNIENKIELIEQSRQHMHSVIDEHYNNLINSLKFGMNFSNIKGMLKQYFKTVTANLKCITDSFNSQIASIMMENYCSAVTLNR